MISLLTFNFMVTSGSTSGSIFARASRSDVNHIIEMRMARIMLSGKVERLLTL